MWIGTSESWEREICSFRSLIDSFKQPIIWLFIVGISSGQSIAQSCFPGLADNLSNLEVCHCILHNQRPLLLLTCVLKDGYFFSFYLFSILNTTLRPLVSAGLVIGCWLSSFHLSHELALLYKDAVNVMTLHHKITNQVACFFLKEFEHKETFQAKEVLQGFETMKHFDEKANLISEGFLWFLFLSFSCSLTRRIIRGWFL